MGESCAQPTARPNFESAMEASALAQVLLDSNFGPLVTAVQRSYLFTLLRRFFSLRCRMQSLG